MRGAASASSSLIKSRSVPQALKEKTELQAELAALDARLRAQREETRVSSERQASLAWEVSSLRSERGGLERAVAELQGQLEEKNAGLESLSKDLQLAEEQYQRLMGRVEDMQQGLSTRDSTGEEELTHTHTRGGNKTFNFSYWD